MLDLGWSEILVIAIVLIVVVGPKDLPRVLRGFGRTTAKLRSMAGDFRRQFDEALREAELDDVKGLADDFRKLDPRAEIRKHFTPLEEAGREIRDGLGEAAKAKPAVTGTASTPEPAAPLKNGAASLPGDGGSSAASATQPAAKAEPSKDTKPAVAKKRTPAAKPASAKKTSAAKATAATARKPSARKKKTAGTAS
ncbi:Sec-independent protein translocase protein TatB [Chelativorans sp. AA-79]|uniref:Sec-independent protein translocase protein TatB n=1 Tax=Chelativorans sp. AA-79 TaxID=3028735 RepID=UPI0023F8207F|nr:Sec-independent protein translocase protein TatB [Chelativorans sp. AA-79]WEX07327.1 Sec-independent protein translocase protein TatB [Chelativorans sp. AA-79]